MAFHHTHATILLDPRNRILSYKTIKGDGEFHLTKEFETCVATRYFANRMDKVKLEFKSEVVHSKTQPYRAVCIFIISDTRVANDLVKKINHLSRYGVVEFPRVSGGRKNFFIKYLF